jgi:sulfur-carrier protein
VAESATESGEPRDIRVTVRYFAAARAAAGTESESVTVRSGDTVADVVHGLAKPNAQLSTVLSRCSYLCDGIAVGAEAATVRPVESGQTIDVLPPFAGG